MTDTLRSSGALDAVRGRHLHSRADQGWRSALHTWWAATTPRTRTAYQVGLLLVAVGVAYNYSLTTLLQSAGQDTPLAYVSLVPAIALALAAIRARPMKPEPPIFDRHVDYTVGLPLLAVALAVLIVLPSRWSTMFWVYRADLFSLPFFVAGVVAIVFGVRVMWRQKLAIAYLFLAWPYPYQSVLLRVLNGFTAATLFAIERILTVVHVATPVSSVDSTLFSVVHDGRSFPLSIVSACSGVNSVVGFLLVGSAFAAVVRGPLLRKVGWLVGGMVLLWALNLGRILFIFWAGQTWGQDVAINVLHPFVGMVSFTLGVVVMVVLLKPVGLHIGIGERGPTVRTTGSGAARSGVHLAVPKVLLVLAVALGAAAVLGAADIGLRSYNLVATASGEPKLVAYVNKPMAPRGWTIALSDTFNWAKPLFGDTSVWDRYTMTATAGGDLQTSTPVVADVINTPNLQSFSAYGIENCYQFHGYALANVAQVNLPGGITGQSMSYASAQFGSWSLVYWIVPVKMGSSSSPNYERVVLYVRNAGSGVTVSSANGRSVIKNLSGSLDPHVPGDAALVRNRAFLVQFASELIEAQAGSPVPRL